MTMMDEELDFDILTAPILEEKPWATFAACKDAPEVSFFPQTKTEARAALAVCGICPVREDCLDHAIETSERFGVWGGMTEKERKFLTRVA